MLEIAIAGETYEYNRNVSLSLKKRRLLKVKPDAIQEFDEQIESKEHAEAFAKG